MRALVTGGAGFIGRRLVRRLLDRGDEVAVLDDLSFSQRADVPEGAAFTGGDAADLALVEELARHRDVIFHMAAIASVPFSHKDPLRAHRSNAVTTLAVLEAARRTGSRVVATSSAAVYGDGGEIQGESDPTRPKSFYGADKLYGESVLRLYVETFGTRGISLRPFNVYGPGQPAASGAVVPLLVERALTHRPIEIDGDGLQTRDLTYVDDVARAFVLAGDAPDDVLDGRALNVARGRGTTVLDVVDAIRRVVGEVEVHHRPMPPERKGDIRHSRADIARIGRDLGFKPEVDLDEGIARTAAWWRQGLPIA